MKTRIMTLNNSNTFDGLVAHFELYSEIQAAAGITPVFRGPHENELQKVGIV